MQLRCDYGRRGKVGVQMACGIGSSLIVLVVMQSENVPEAIEGKKEGWRLDLETVLESLHRRHQYYLQLIGELD